jgi:hypothetical protein
VVPNVRLDSVRQVMNDGNHNAFTDLCHFRGMYYLTFRSCPDGHMLFTSSRIRVMRSADTRSWQEVCAFNVPDRDVRDPHFMVYGDALYVLSGTWLVDPLDSRHTDLSEHQGYCVRSADGATWEGPLSLNGTHGYYIWRGGAYGDKAYMIGRCYRESASAPTREEGRETTEAWFMQSSDGLSWQRAGRIQPSYGDEIAFLFEPGGSVLAVARGGRERVGQVCRAQPPYTEWTRTDLSRNIGGPMLSTWGDRYLVGGRKITGPKPVTVLYWLVNDALEEILELPSGGDNSYPGFLELSPTQGLLSYYSSHEGSGTSLAPSAIYLAELSIEP